MKSSCLGANGPSLIPLQNSFYWLVLLKKRLLSLHIPPFPHSRIHKKRADQKRISNCLRVCRQPEAWLSLSARAPPPTSQPNTYSVRGSHRNWACHLPSFLRLVNCSTAFSSRKRWCARDSRAVGSIRYVCIFAYTIATPGDGEYKKPSFIRLYWLSPLPAQCFPNSRRPHLFICL